MHGLGIAIGIGIGPGFRTCDSKVAGGRLGRRIQWAVGWDATVVSCAGIVRGVMRGCKMAAGEKRGTRGIRVVGGGRRLAEMMLGRGE